MILVLGLVVYSGVYGGEGLHETMGNLIIILAGIHVAGVIADSLLIRENLTAAMVTGRKYRLAAGYAGVPPMKAAWRALGVTALTAVVTVFGFNQGQALKWPPMESELEEQERGEYEEGQNEVSDEEYEKAERDHE